MTLSVTQLSAAIFRHTQSCRHGGLWWA